MKCYRKIGALLCNHSEQTNRAPFMPMYCQQRRSQNHTKMVTRDCVRLQKCIISKDVRSISNKSYQFFYMEKLVNFTHFKKNNDINAP